MTLYALDDFSPQLPEDGDCWIAPDANLIGRVMLHGGTSIWFGATLRGDNEPITIGEGSNIQENCIIHTDKGYPATVGRNCTIGHRAILHGCTIMDGTLVGMGATVLNGATIGRGCIIGAGALVAEGKTIPDGSLVVGIPGKVVRELDDTARAANLASAQNYANKMRHFKTALMALDQD